MFCANAAVDDAIRTDLGLRTTKKYENNGGQPCIVCPPNSPDTDPKRLGPGESKSGAKQRVGQRVIARGFPRGSHRCTAPFNKGDMHDLRYLGNVVLTEKKEKREKLREVKKRRQPSNLELNLEEEERYLMFYFLVSLLKPTWKKKLRKLNPAHWYKTSNFLS